MNPGATPLDRSPVSDARAGWVVCASTAVFGFALAIALAPRFRIPARPSDALSALTRVGLSPAGVILQFVAAVLLTAGFAIVGARVARLLAGFRWAAISYCTAMLLAPVALIYYGNLRHVALLAIAGAAIVGVRRLEPQFSSGDVVLVPIVMSCYLAFLDLGFGKTPIATFLRALMAVFAIRLIVRASDAMVLSPLALLAQIDWLPATVGAGVALVVLFVTPLVLMRRPLRISRKLVYPIVVLVYPLAIVELPPPSTADFFEDSHNIPVATEMLRGGRPYADIVPTHGLISDALIDYTAMKMGVNRVRSINTIRVLIGTLSGLAIYALAMAVTGSAEAGLLAVFLAVSFTPGSLFWFRPAAALFALAAIIAATRLRCNRWFVAAGALTVLAYLVSIDFGLYVAIVALFSAFRSRALRHLALGVALVAIPALAVFAVFGFAGAFLHVNAFEILGGHGVYFMKPLQLPDCLRSTALLGVLPVCTDSLLWIVALLATCAALARSPFRARRGDGPWIIGVWVVVAAISFVERGNNYYYQAMVPFVFGALWQMRRDARTLAAVLFVAFVLLTQPLRHVIDVIPTLHNQAPGPLFNPTVTASIEAARRFAATLQPGETFVDFSNSALLYALLNRDCPLRHVEVASYQSEEMQREVIRRIETNPRIRAALIVFPGSLGAVDGISNSERAPLVWGYLQKHFAPAFEQDGVVFWKRAPHPGLPAQSSPVSSFTTWTTFVRFMTFSSFSMSSGVIGTPVRAPSSRHASRSARPSTFFRDTSSSFATASVRRGGGGAGPAEGRGWRGRLAARH